MCFTLNVLFLDAIIMRYYVVLFSCFDVKSTRRLLLLLIYNDEIVQMMMMKHTHTKKMNE